VREFLSIQRFRALRVTSKGLKTMTTWAPRVLSALRIVAALLFMEHGLMKLFHFPIAQSGLPDPLPVQLVVAALLEVVGGALLTLGLGTRAVAFVCSGQMAAAYLMAHAPAGFWPAANGGGEAILYCFIFLYIAFAGGGAWSLDAWFSARRNSPD
jgi:putative oxidoreductase